jgi:hypothetical protein
MNHHDELLVASIESSVGALSLQRDRRGLGYRLTARAEGFGAGRVDNELTPRLKHRGAMLGDQRETEGDMFLPIVVSAASPTDLRGYIARLTNVMKPADGTFRIITTNPATGEQRYRDVAYREGLETPEWSSPYERLYRISVDYEDPWAYSTAPSSTRIGSAPSQGAAGWVAPFIFPLVAGGLGGPEVGSVTNGGDRPAPLTVTFGGQVTEPRVRNLATGAVVGVRGSLAWDERITIDAMAESVEFWRTGDPHIRQSVPGRLIRATRLTKMSVPPGDSPFEFRSQTASAAFVELSAPSAYTSLQ